VVKDPAFLFYSSDFLTGVAGLTMEERGQYITLLCLQHQKGRLSEKTCRLALGLQCLTDAQDVMAKFSIDENGLYYNNRLEIEIEKRAERANVSRFNGTKGGRPKTQIKPSENPQDNSRLGLAKPTKNLGENENENVNVNEVANKTENLFDVFWQAYPKKKSKGDAEKAWKSINPGKELVATMVNHLAQAKTSREWTKDGGQFIPYPATWLRAKGWEDELPVKQGGTHNAVSSRSGEKHSNAIPAGKFSTVL